MNISELSIRHHVFTWMLMFGLIFFGAIAYNSMGVSLNPDIDFPVANINVTYQGAAPEVIEKDVIEVIESAIVAVPNIKQLTSTARTGQASINVEFELNQDIDVAIQELTSRISRAQRQLPDNIDPPTISKSNPEDSPIMYLAVERGKLETRDLMLLLRERVQDSLAATPGVSEATVLGFVEPQLRVDLDMKKLNYFELTPADVVEAIQREHLELPAGSIFQGEKEEYLRILGEVTTAEDLQKILITRRGGSPVYAKVTVGDVAHVYQGTEDPNRISRVNGKSTGAIGIRKQREANSVAVAEAVAAKIEQINKTLPEGTKLTINFDTTTFIKEAVHELVFTIFISAALTALVCWIFLGSLSATFNIILAIPTSIIGSFIFMKLFNFTLNTFTLLGLSLAIGIVVDDAIIMLENIYRHRETEKDPIKSAIIGSREIMFAILATTAAVVAIFLPLAFIRGLIGRFIFQFGVTLSIAVLLSCVEALTLAPMRISRFRGGLGQRTRLGMLFDKGMELTANGYGHVIRHVLRFRILYLIAVLGLFVGSLFIVKKMKFELTPAVDEARAFINLKTPEGSSIDYTDGKVKEVEAAVQGLPFIERYFVSVGGFGGAGRANQANLVMVFKPSKERQINPATQKPWALPDIEKAISEKLKTVKGVRGFVRTNFAANIGSTGGSGQPIEFTVKGPEYEKLRENTRKLMDKLEATGKLSGINSDTIDATPELHIVPDRTKALQYGVEVNAIATALNTTFAGTEAAEYTEGNRRYPIFVTLNKKERNSPERIEGILVRNNRGQLVKLSELVRIEDKSGPLTIFRSARQRGIVVSAGLTPKFSQGEAVDLVGRVAKENLPEGYFIEFSGATLTFQETSTSVLIVLCMGIIVSYMVLASQFNSFLDPVTILIALPFSISGALVSLWATDQTINMYSMIGIILLMGIAKKNSILLVEFTNQLREHGKELKEALVEAGRLRLRPILMTSIACVAGAVPSAFNFGPGAETRIPMAVAVIGGILISTPLTLFAVPIVYSLFAKLSHAHDEKKEDGSGKGEIGEGKDEKRLIAVHDA